MVSSQSTRSPRPSPGFSSLCALGASALSFPSCPCSGGPSGPRLSLTPSPSASRLSLFAKKPENVSLLFSYSYTLFCRAQNAKPLTFKRFRTLWQKHPGWGSHLSNERVQSVPGSFSDHDSPNTNHNSRPLLATRHSAAVYPERGRRATKPFRIRTYEKCACNFFRIRTSKIQDLKSFRICTYEKRPGEGVLTTCANLPWRMTHLRRLSMILNAAASDAATFGHTDIGTMGQTRSARAISEKRAGSHFSRSEVRNILEHVAAADWWSCATAGRLSVLREAE
jgi:hypothetical protein